MRNGANQDAVPLLEKATAEDPRFAMARTRLAEAQMDARQAARGHGRRRSRPGARGEGAAAPRRALPDPRRVALVKEDNETAAKSYGELAELYPDDPDVQMARGRAAEALGKRAEALAAYQRVVRAQPRYGAALRAGTGSGGKAGTLGRGDPLDAGRAGSRSSSTPSPRRSA